METGLVIMLALVALPIVLIALVSGVMIASEVKGISEEWIIRKKNQIRRNQQNEWTERIRTHSTGPLSPRNSPPRGSAPVGSPSIARTSTPFEEEQHRIIQSLFNDSRNRPVHQEQQRNLEVVNENSFTAVFNDDGHASIVRREDAIVEQEIKKAIKKKQHKTEKPKDVPVEKVEEKPKELTAEEKAELSQYADLVKKSQPFRKIE